MFFFYQCENKKQQVARSFYYWKSEFAISDEENRLLDTLHVNKLYVKYFDVDWNNELQKPIPVATINFENKGHFYKTIIPVVYIVNNVLVNLKSEDVADLAIKISRKINEINLDNNIVCKEVQFDCDWSDATQKKYFALLQELRKYFPARDYTLSATIRLHQVKYRERTGVPSVDRGMLMFYNMGNVKSPDTSNSIFNKKLAEKYIDRISKYPLPLDVALPIFTWGIHFRGTKPNSIVNNLSTENVKLSGLFTQRNKQVWIANDGCFFRGEYFLKEDILKMEEVTPEVCNEAIDLLLPEIKNTNFNVAFYHFDSTNTKRYEIKNLEAMYHRFE